MSWAWRCRRQCRGRFKSSTRTTAAPQTSVSRSVRRGGDRLPRHTRGAFGSRTARPGRTTLRACTAGGSVSAKLDNLGSGRRGNHPQLGSCEKHTGECNGISIAGRLVPPTRSESSSRRAPHLCPHMRSTCASFRVSGLPDFLHFLPRTCSKRSDVSINVRVSPRSSLCTSLDSLRPSMMG